jgi:hypothetical protein
MMRSSKAKRDRAKLRQHLRQVEAERGWAGQYGQHPANDEELNYRPVKTTDGNKLRSPR